MNRAPKSPNNKAQGQKTKVGTQKKKEDASRNALKDFSVGRLLSIGDDSIQRACALGMER
jgi:hypothetical protein